MKLFLYFVSCTEKKSSDCFDNLETTCCSIPVHFIVYVASCLSALRTIHKSTCYQTVWIFGFCKQVSVLILYFKITMHLLHITRYFTYCKFSENTHINKRPQLDCGLEPSKHFLQDRLLPSSCRDVPHIRVVLFFFWRPRRSTHQVNLRFCIYIFIFVFVHSLCGCLLSRLILNRAAAKIKCRL